MTPSIDLPCLLELQGPIPEAVALLKMVSLMKGDSHAPYIDGKSKLTPTAGDDESISIQASRESLLRSLNGWGPEVTLEIRNLMVPEINLPVYGRSTVSLAIRVADPDRERVRELILARYLELRSLLPVYWAESEFEPVTDIEEAQYLMAPFDTRHAAALIRKRTKHTVSFPLPSARVPAGGVMPRSVFEAIQPFQPSLDSWERLIEVLARQLDPVLFLVRLRPGSDPAPLVERLRSDIETAETLLGRQVDREIPIDRALAPLRDLALAHLMQVSKGAFDLGVLLLSSAPIRSSLLRIAGDAVSSSDNLLQGGFCELQVNPDQAGDIDYFPENLPFTTTESSAAFRLPSPPNEDAPCLPIRRSRTSFAEVSRNGAHETDGIHLFMNRHRGVSQPVSIGSDALMTHVLTVGATGTGKTTLLKNMIAADINNNRGVAVIDPHGDLIEDILGRIPEDRAEDVILIDLSDKDCSVGFNPIQWSTLDERDLIIDEIYNTFDSTYDFMKTGGPIFEQNFRGMLKTLQGDDKSAVKRGGYKPNLLDFPRCYTDSKFRQWLCKTISDPQVHQFIEELERTGGEASMRNISPYITSKFSRLLHDNRLKKIIVQDTKFDFDAIMNEGMIFLVNLSKGRFGSVVAALLMNFFLSRFKLAAMKRGELPPEKRRDFHLFIDEAHNIPGENLSILLSEARKYRLSLTLATQYCAQIGNHIGNSDNSLLSAVLGNVGSIILFRLGIEDAQKMAPVLYPNFSALDVVNLPDYEGYARIHGTSVLPFSFRTEPVNTPKNPRLGERIRNFSREKYGCRAEDADMMIQARATFVVG